MACYGRKSKFADEQPKVSSMPATLWVMAISLPLVMVFDLPTSAADDGL